MQNNDSIILWDQWVKTNDAKKAFEKWKKIQLKKIKSPQKPLNSPQAPQYNRSNPPPNQAYLYDPEFSSWCAHRDSIGKDY